MGDTVADTYRALRDHVNGFWKDRVHEERIWPRGPISRTLPRLRVRRVAPRTRAESWVYVTIGAWEVGGGQPMEFSLLSPVDAPENVETLSMVANFHADPRYRLRVGSIMRIGRPWIPDARADHLLVSIPYPFKTTFEWCDTPSEQVRFLWLVPILAQEAAYARKHGVEALEDRLEQHAADVVDRRRPAVV
jgi:Suppressor of fused protein (SUFU)